MDGRRSLGQVLLGVLVVLAGVVLLLDRTGALDVDLGTVAATLWPLAVVLVGVTSLLLVPRAWYGPLVITVAGVVLLLDRLDVLDVSVWDYLWPVAVIFIGLGITVGAAARDEQGERITAIAFWWGTERRTRSRTFRSASLTAIMGGVELDLREADIDGTARVDVFAFWGGVEIKVPRTWEVRTSGLPLLGAWENKTEPPAGGGPVLDVRLVTIMGGAEIRHGKRSVQPGITDAPVV
ncbi:LiaI-LiaF-like domain-containing protein [Cellulomonas wangsupingiae]|uniref:Cell wall-active antibiotics response protein n=1 Tax=Cellulomonas wangsupingiae TaxID=2968085 RepID=A0ABY5K5J3_9CELL|nr:DUF5668 domain-containing protein [Cellulomonas wangsupingiae]MCC2336304.1 cell wall-active antibiotics response protein [Cellulomonas wangsupingiae]MCM0640694.1 cell wall-active antibiotics response protein [Cellulomonas wangsupingiae]UUI65717.1 cell wall-active antibiotics response protein [Cellulomonas wangsupingiae]